MKRFFTYIIYSAFAVSLLGAPVFALDSECPEGATASECSPEPSDSRIEPRETETDEPQPTFTAELNKSKQTSGLWAGKNFLLAGNELTNYTDVKNGLLFAAGNSLQLKGVSEYGFVAGNIVDFAGTTSRDLYVAGNIVTLTKDAQVGRDVFVASNELYLNTSLSGALSVTAAKVIIADGVTISGNVNLDAREIIFGQGVTIGGTLVYNDSAAVSGVENAQASQTEVYHVEEVSTGARFATAVYAKFLSIAGLFIAMVLMLFVCPKLRDKVQEINTTERVLATTMGGLGALAVVPIVSIFALFTIVGAPVGVIALAFYALGTYLAQGVTGMWLGHALMSRITKIKVNLYLKTLIGITLLGLVALVPLVSIATGFVSLAFGFGTIISYVKSARIQVKQDKVLAKAASPKAAKSALKQAAKSASKPATKNAKSRKSAKK